MRWSDIPFTPSQATLRGFAAVGAVLLAAAGWRQLAHDHPAGALASFAAALVVGVVGLVFPAVFRPVFVGWIVLVFPVGWLTSEILLIVVYACLFIPLGLFFKLIQRDVLARRMAPDRETYWVDKPGARDTRSYFRQS